MSLKTRGYMLVFSRWIQWTNVTLEVIDQKRVRGFHNISLMHAIVPVRDSETVLQFLDPEIYLKVNKYTREGCQKDVSALERKSPY